MNPGIDQYIKENLTSDEDFLPKSKPMKEIDVKNWVDHVHNYKVYIKNKPKTLKLWKSYEDSWQKYIEARSIKGNFKVFKLYARLKRRCKCW